MVEAIRPHESSLSNKTNKSCSILIRLYGQIKSAINQSGTVAQDLGRVSNKVNMMATQHSVKAPLAQRLRPKSLDEVIGQAHLLSLGAPLRALVERQYLPSLILYGDAGIGKTTIAMLLADAVGRPFHALSALNTGVKQLREVLESDGLNFAAPVVFIDEIHRFNKANTKVY